MAGRPAIITPEQRAEIISLYGTGAADTIGPSFGISGSRVRVIWYEDRKARGVKGSRGGPRAVRMIARAKRVKAERHSRPDVALRALQSYWPVPAPANDNEPPIDTGVTLSQLDQGDGRCRWPIGKDSDGQCRFCGVEQMRPSTQKATIMYCAEHAERALISPLYAAPRSVSRVENRPWVKLTNKLMGPGERFVRREAA